MKTSDYLTITFNGETRELFMSFALINSLATPLQTIDQLTLLDESPEVRDYILRTLLAERNAQGVVTKEASLSSLSLETAEIVLAWAMEHLTDFFARRLKAKNKILKQVNKTLAQ